MSTSDLVATRPGDVSESNKRKTEPWVPRILVYGLWLLIIGFAIRFFFRDALRYTDLTPEVYQHYWPNRVALMLHILGGSVALLLGPAQFSARLRSQRLQLHRWMGRFYVGGIVLGSAAAFYLSVHTPSITFGTSLFALASVWLASTLMALASVLNRQLEAHRQWMIRSYALTYGFVMFRFLVDLEIAGIWGPERAATVAWVLIVCTLFFCELGIQWKRTFSRKRKVSATA